MKQTCLFILTILLFTYCKKDNIETNGQPNYYTYNGSIVTNDNSTLMSYDNNLIICGIWDRYISILKISKTGVQIWRNDLDGDNLNTASGIAETSNHDLFICGHTSRNYSTSKNDILIIKTNSLGDTIWTKTYGGSESEYGENIIPTSDGNLLISGKTESFGAGSYGDLYLIKVNTNGDTIWTKSFSDQNQEVPFNLIETQNGEYLLTGTNEDNNDPRELYLLKVSQNGTQIWNKKIGPATWKWGYSAIELSDENLLICGSHTIGEGYSQVLIVKTNKTGDIIWEKEYGEEKLSEIGYSIKQNNDGQFTITGSSYNVITMLEDIILLKIDQDGNQVWFITFKSSIWCKGLNLIKDTNDDNIITGNYNDRIFMTKTDNDGNFK